MRGPGSFETDWMPCRRWRFFCAVVQGSSTVRGL